MSSDGDEYGDFVEEDLVAALSQVSQVLPPPRDDTRPAKRQRIGPSASHGSSDGFETDNGDRLATGKRRSASRQPGVRANNGEEEGQKKKSKYQIHKPKDQEVPPMRVQYGTQLPQDPDSSPYRIRGAVWKLPKPVTAAPLPSSTTRSVEVRPPPFRPRNVTSTGSLDSQVSLDLADRPSDAFSSSPEPEPRISPDQSHLPPSSMLIGHSQPIHRLAAPQNALRQTTLFGGRAPDEPRLSQVNKVYNYRVDQIPELPSHHSLDFEAMKTWVYPTNLGITRNYQYSIVKNGLFNNTLVALPTGLGKTFIAATIMLNFYRWTRDAQIVFMAPTKPLASQQIDACFNIVGIPRSVTTYLTGDIVPAIRVEEWREKRVFFVTPQTFENDLRNGHADPKRIVLLVVDEAHRATGNYSYVKVVDFLRKFNQSYRVLALTATPGSSVEAVQEVIDGLDISKVEIRTEDSIDIQQYVHSRKTELILLDPSDEIIMVKDLFGKALQPLVDKLCSQNGYWNKDPMALTPFGLLKAQQDWAKSDAARRANEGLKGMIRALFTVLMSVAHSIKLLNFHGISSFYEKINDFRSTVEDQGEKGSKYKRQVVESPHFRTMMDRMKSWINNDNFVGHPKLTYLCETILNHFMDAGEGRLPEGAPPSSTRVIVFSEFRDSAEEISRVLNRHGPMIRSSVFVGQADSRRSEGMNQVKQQETIKNFKTGVFNVIVATSIGEEGLDIGQVDLIVCYDSSSSPIRMLQRMGRTGRKRAGKIVLLLMRGKEEESFSKAKDNYEQIQKMISEGTRFNFHFDRSKRIVPKSLEPLVDKRSVEIPFENTQDGSLPEPKRRRNTKQTKKPPKKFSMPDGVDTGFKKASKLVKGANGLEDIQYEPTFELLLDQVKPIPELGTVLLGDHELKLLERDYQNVQEDDMQEVGIPEMNKHPILQRSLRPMALVKHGQCTKRFVMMLSNMRKVTDSTIAQWQHLYEDSGIIDGRGLSPGLFSESGILPSEISASEGLNDYSEDEADRTPILVKRPARKVASNGKVRQTRTGERGESMEHSDTNTGHDSAAENDEDDLDGFIVHDEDPQDTLKGKQIMNSSSTPSEVQFKSTPFYQPTHFNPTQDTNDEDEIPDVGLLLGRNQPQISPLPMENQSDSELDLSHAHRAKRRRRVVVEVDSDE